MGKYNQQKLNRSGKNRGLILMTAPLPSIPAFQCFIILHVDLSGFGYFTYVNKLSSFYIGSSEGKNYSTIFFAIFRLNVS